ncbi:SRPBCC family protein [Nucisporomicrobium flavum]|uniref:SRPBCC family protein n=1 Tax=Nucisporomicrobium flavum TaxID=2785915 RepID=UPI0018F55D88|nr:SRPBCC family protein [Nucisporomicrobium flavum]
MATTTKGSAKVTLPADNQILITREFNAPARAVWKAYTTPELIRRWWAGQRGTVTSVDVDLRVGGRWRYVMTANPGFEVAFHGEYREIQEPVRLVNTEAFEGIPDPDGNAALVTMTLTEKDGRTAMEMLVEHHDQAGRDAHVNSGMEGGMQEAMDALEELAASLT